MHRRILLRALAVSEDIWNVKTTLPIGVLEGSDHEVLLNCVQAALLSDAVAPDGKPLTLNTVASGSCVPAVGVMASMYVAVFPGATVCAMPEPLLPDPLAEPGFTPKSRTICEDAALVAVTKFASPP
jgi:hypothetical protein